ncbi:hypothetical protein UFOVP1305_63 [uncultured Caudovirales phage]|uniref:Uncharacterized protein n=1 Tax=uncultured Caudovirales phage TaxID=2100421 RepID=A0A6J5RXE5_9CAUD|nr:hypothetical protein UFOVP896_8 [uncultured Caudovirales phage]CAB4198261.1 hypothetical protein UFOVP1305_63 [uncultured Caudovirales phage]
MTAFAEARSKAAAALDRAWDAFVRLNDLRLEGN